MRARPSRQRDRTIGDYLTDDDDDDDDAIDLVGFVLGPGAYVDGDGFAHATTPVWEVDGRKATSWNMGFGPSFNCWVDEIPLLEADAVLYGNVYVEKSARSGVCSRIDPSRVTPAP